MISLLIDSKEQSLICSERELCDKIKKAAQQTSGIEFECPADVNFFTICPQVYIKEAVTIRKLNSYIAKHHEILSTDYNALKDVIIVHRRRLLCLDVSDSETQMLAEHFQYFESLINNNLFPFPGLSNQFIIFQLAANSVGICLCRNFPEYILSFGQLSFDVFFNCLTQFATRPHNYDFLSVKRRLTEMIEYQFQKFLENFSILETGNQIFALKNFILKLLGIYEMKDEDNPFKEQILNDLVTKPSFGCTMFAVFKKIGCLSQFKRWLQLLIDLNKYQQAIGLAQLALFYYSNLMDHLDIVDLIEKNEDWGRQWIFTLINNKFEMIEGIFFSGVPYYFTILNKLLVLYKFEDENDFKTKLTQIKYEQAARTLIHTEQSKQSMYDLFKYFFEDPDAIVNSLLKDEDFHPSFH